MGRLVLALSVVLGWAAPVSAHLGSTKYLSVSRTRGGARVVASLDVDDAGIALGLGMGLPDARLLSRSALLEAWLSSGLSVSGEGGTCVATTGAPDFDSRDGRRFVIVPFDFACPAPVRGLVLRDDTIFDEDPQHQAIVTVRGSDGERAQVLRAGAQEIALDEPPSAAATAGAFLVEGMVHLATGYDHLLFLLSLLLGGTLVARRRALRDAGLLVTSFTVGHSVSLALATLGVLTLPSRPVEVCIAASIVVVAVMNVAQAEDRRARPALALCFGVVHGFGFASVLSVVGLPTASRALALFCFNAGIEIAQLAFVAALLPLLGWIAASSSTRERLVVRAGSLAIAAVAAIWVIERVASV